MYRNARSRSTDSGKHDKVELLLRKVRKIKVRQEAVNLKTAKIQDIMRNNKQRRNTS